MKEKMQAVRLHAIGNLRTDIVEKPVPTGKQLLLKVEACGICGSDIPRVFSLGTSKQKYPLTIGHEFSGRIVAVGEEANPDMVGKKGCVIPLIPCHHCESCQSGHYAMCEDYDYLGSRRDGGFAEYCIIPGEENFIESVGKNVTFEELAMLEPACVAQHAVRKSGLFAGANIVVFGAGPIGIMVARWAKLFGADTILVVDVLDEKVTFAEERGFTAVNSKKEDVVEKLLELTNGRLADVVFEATGAGAAFNSSIDCIRDFGTITLIGNPMGDATILRSKYSKLLRKEIKITSIWNSHFAEQPINEWKYTVKMMDSDKFRIQDLVSHRVNLTELPALFDGIHNKTINICKALYTAEKADVEA